MSQNEAPFQIDVRRLKARAKEQDADKLQAVDLAGEAHGFVSREPTGRRGRRPSPRTGQVHAKVLPQVAAAIADEARRRGTQQGIIIEEAWALYLEKNG